MCKWLVIALVAACGNKEEETPAPPAPDPSAPVTPEGSGSSVPEDSASAPVATQAGPCESPGATAEAEGNDASINATRLGSGAAATGTIGRKIDEDWFIIETCGEKLVRIELTNAPATTSPVDYRVTIFGSDAQREVDTLTHYDGADGTTVLAGTYYVETADKMFFRVGDHASDDHDPAGGYRLTVTVVPVPDAEAEPNGNRNDDTNRALAGALTAGTAASGFIAAQHDHDWWKFEVTEETLLRIEATNAPATASPVDLRVAIYNPRNEEIDALTHYDGNDGITNVRTVVYAGEPGTYYVMLSDHGEEDVDLAAPYQLTITPAPVPDAAQEPNGNANDDTNRAHATALTPGAPATGFIASQRDQDWLEVEHGGGDLRVTVATTATATNVDYRVVIQDADGNEVAAESDYDGSDGITSVAVTASAVAAGTYYVIVTDHGDEDWDAENPYTVTLGGG